MGLTQDSSTAGVNEKDLEALKVHVNDTSYPTLDFGRALNTYVDAFPQSRRQIAIKLNALEKVSWISKAMSLAKFPAADLTPWEGKRLSERDIDKALEDLKKLNPRQSDVNEGEPGVNQGPIDVNLRQSSVNQGEPGVNHDPIDVNLRQSGVNQGEAGVNQDRIDVNLRQSSVNQGEPGVNHDPIDVNLRQSGVNQGEAGVNQDRIDVNLRQSGVNQGEAGVNQDRIDVNLRQSSVNQGEPGVNHDPIDVNLRQSGVNQGGAGVNQDPNDVNLRQSGVNQGGAGVNPIQRSDNLGIPLIRDTTNSLVRLFFFWVRDPDQGQVVERWAIWFAQIGWLRVGLKTVGVALFAYGAWHLSDVLRSRLLALGNKQVTLPGALSLQPGATIPAPRLTDKRWIAGHRLELRWADAGPGYRYRVYRHSLDGHSIDPMTSSSSDLKTPGAIISISQVWGKSLVSVTAINAQEEESAHSERREFEPTAMNQLNDVEPLPEQGTEVAAGGSGLRAQGNTKKHSENALAQSPKPGARSAVLLLPPSEVHATVLTPDLIRLTWRAVGTDYRYNIYSSAERTLTSLRKENENPLKSNVVNWTPETGLARYWIVVTTLDKSGNESAYSEAIEVVRRPEKSSENFDEAAKTLRKVLPW